MSASERSVRAHSGTTFLVDYVRVLLLALALASTPTPTSLSVKAARAERAIAFCRTNAIAPRAPSARHNSNESVTALGPLRRQMARLTHNRLEIKDPLRRLTETGHLVDIKSHTQTDINETRKRISTPNLSLIELRAHVFAPLK